MTLHAIDVTCAPAIKTHPLAGLFLLAMSFHWHESIQPKTYGPVQASRGQEQHLGCWWATSNVLGPLPVDSHQFARSLHLCSTHTPPSRFITDDATPPSVLNH